MKKLHQTLPLAAAVLFGTTALSASAFEITSGDWKFDLNGNVNVHYIYSSCKDQSSAKPVSGGLACVGDTGGSGVSTIGNGLLPAALTFGIATTQAGLDIAAHFGLYPGIDTNNGGSPNLGQTAGGNTALGTTGLDVRQVYMTFGSAGLGTFTLGRNFGLFGFDAIINDMTIPGVGVAGSMASVAPANTSLGSIGYGYIYCDTLAQINYTTPSFSGFNFTAGIYNPVNPLAAGGTAQTDSAPGYHGKASYSLPIGSAKLYLSSAFIGQKQKYVDGNGVLHSESGFGVDAYARIDVAGFNGSAYYYHGSGLGTTGLFVLSDDGAGNKRKSDGYLLQGTYTLGKVKLGVNYGVSKLDAATAAESGSALLDTNSKLTGGVYYSLTKNLTLLGEVSRAEDKAHDGDKNSSTNANVGAFLSF